MGLFLEIKPVDDTLMAELHLITEELEVAIIYQLFTEFFCFREYLQLDEQPSHDNHQQALLEV